jgi:energy-coupling factor transport system ATP-binding protein
VSLRLGELLRFSGVERGRVLPPQSVVISSRLEEMGVKRTPSIEDLHMQLRNLLVSAGGCGEPEAR